MGKLAFTTQAAPSAVAGQGMLYPATDSLQWTSKDANSKCLTLGGLIVNANTADVVASAADTYLTGSNITIPAHLLQAKTRFRWSFAMTKTAAGTAAPVWVVRLGTAGTTADAARLTFTSPSAQTAATDTGGVEINAILRNTGAAGVLTGILTMWHANATTGLASVSTVCVQVTSAAFDTTTAGLIAGVSVNPGASGVWTHQLVMAEAHNL